MASRNLKLAALRLAGLERSDQRWVLRRLPATLRKRLGHELAELHQITGGDAAVAQELYGVLALSVETAPSSETESSPIHASLAASLAGLPPILAAAVLKSQTPAVQGGYLRECDGPRRDELRAALADLPGELPPRLAEAIRACVDTPASNTAPGFDELLKGDTETMQEAAA